MGAIERLIIDVALFFTDLEAFNAFLGDPRTVAVIVGGLVSISGAWLGSYLLLRKMSLTSDALSHTVLLGIVVAFMVMAGLSSAEPDLSSPWLIIGAAGAGVLTVMLTEFIHRSGLVKEDAALGLAFPLLFAISIILISRFVDDVHLDQDAVLVGEIGVAWADTNSYCLDNCAPVTITPDDPRAEVGRRCINCEAQNLNPRDPAAVFEEFCANCRDYTAAEAWRERLIDEPPQLAFFPKSISVMGLITLINLGFVLLLYKELKLSTFDAGLAAALGFRPGLLNYLLMVLVSVTAVGAFDAVGAILVVAFFIIPPATAYLLTDRLSLMLVLSPVLGALAVFTGYDLARGEFLGFFAVEPLLRLLDDTVGLGGYTEWNTSISAAMVMMAFVIFLFVWIISPGYGLISTLLRRWAQCQRFAQQMLLGHIYHHQGTGDARHELALPTLHEHLNWTPNHLHGVLHQLRARRLVRVDDQLVMLTVQGERSVTQFMRENLVPHELV